MDDLLLHTLSVPASNGDGSVSSPGGRTSTDADGIESSWPPALRAAGRAAGAAGGDFRGAVGCVRSDSPTNTVHYWLATCPKDPIRLWDAIPTWSRPIRGPQRVPFYHRTYHYIYHRGARIYGCGAARHHGGSESFYRRCSRYATATYEIV